MKNILRTILAVSFFWAGNAAAQDVKPNLNAAPVPAATTAPVTTAAQETEAKAKPSWSGPKLSYGLSAGASFSSGFGSATYLEPTVRYQVSNRFRVNTSLTYINAMPYSTSAVNPEGNTVVYRNNGSSHYIGSVGLDYLASDRLILSGNIWRDFSNMPANNLNSSFYSPGRMGADFRATYKITEHFTVTGGIRYTDGATPFNAVYGPGFGNFNRFGMGY
ncbi:hypothetical protein ABID22_003549 [Pontibacter aydingkolensis]|uniref:Outer membrane protein beta-barrel domain-containing protein n=1 Tax=Pontibacter aydingkolensis TaxID=1911536 RepID=A0ABS7CYY7_9BACT|nr:hypothetical protein [Pontibacter aydingkolensis]MBW7468901.1 hypothetical protein [Pontibacter aydingkolensis]